MTEAEIRADERKKIAAFVADFSWILPLYGDPDVNEAADDAACSVCEQISVAILERDG